MKFRGKKIFKDLSDKEIRFGVESKLKDLLVRVDRNNVNVSNPVYPPTLYESL